MITIPQLLESVDLDFKPRWIAKDKGGLICVYTEKPECGICSWYDGGDYIHIGYLKLAEFDGKDWTECIYEVPRKTTGKIKQIALSALVDEQIEDPFSRDIWIHTIVDKVAELVDAVNELKGAKND